MAVAMLLNPGGANGFAGSYCPYRVFLVGPTGRVTTKFELLQPLKPVGSVVSLGGYL